MAPLQIWLGDSSGTSVFADQPAKGAAIEGHWNTNPPGTGAAWAVVAWPDKARQRNDWAVRIPDLLSVLATRSPTGRVIGLKAFTPRDQPPLLPLIFYAFRIMVAIGFYFFFLVLFSLWAWWRGWLHPTVVSANRWLLRAWVADEEGTGRDDDTRL